MCSVTIVPLQWARHRENGGNRVLRILREIVRVHHAYDSDRFLVYASAAVGEALKSEESHALAEVEIFVGKQVKVQIEPLYSQEQFDVVMM